MKRPHLSISGTKLLCLVLSICFENIIIKAGMKVKTVSMDMQIALHSTSPTSLPIVKVMKTKENRPPIVVRELDDISTIALLRDSIQASLLLSPVSLSSINLWKKIIA